MDIFDIALMKKFGGGSGGGGGYVLTDADKAEIAEQAAALVPGGGGGVPSWNDIPDKPFGEDDNAVLLPPTQFAYDSAFGLFAVPGYIDFMIGKTYTVNWNGVEYTTEAVPGQFNGEDLVMIGNPAALGGANNGLPFAVACLLGSIGAIPLDGSTAVNVGIKGYWLKKMSAKYLPRTSYTFAVNWSDFETIEGSAASLASISYDTTELVDAILEGCDVYLTMEDYPTFASPRFLIIAIQIQSGGGGSTEFTLEDALRVYINENGKDKVPLCLYTGGPGSHMVWFNSRI